jgi:hypothetical protein
VNAPAELETLRDWLRFAVTRFAHAGLAFGHGFTNAYDEAAYLLLHALHLPLDRLEPFLDARLTYTERSDLAALLTRRIVRTASMPSSPPASASAGSCRYSRGSSSIATLVTYGGLLMITS